jgi:mannose-6-phosphate isomerase-like protein (cupin superfamily)
VADAVRETIEGDGWSVGHLDGLGEGWGFRKVRSELGVTAFGVNAVVMPAGYDAGQHKHERQEELYFVHRGQLTIAFGDGSEHVLDEGGLARVAPDTVRGVRNSGDGDVVYIAIGGEGGYVGRDGVKVDD